jgi:hypothetical protein
MLRILKKPTHDGTYTIYLDGQAVQCGLSSVGADRLIDALRQSLVTGDH